MSKQILRGDVVTSGFEETLGTVASEAIASHRRSASAKVQAGLTTIYDKAMAEGHAEGFEAGRAEGAALGLAEAKAAFEEEHAGAIQEFRAALEGVVARVEGAIEEWYKKTEESISDLAIEVARRALCREMETSRECVLDITRAALTEVRHGTEVRIRVNPFDVGLVDARRDEILAAVSGIRKLEVVGDAKILSGCEIETDGGVIDARIENYMARLAQEAA